MGIVLAQGLKKVPELYTINGNGALNAFASCVPGFRYFSTIYSDILEACNRTTDLCGGSGKEHRQGGPRLYRRPRP